MKVLLATRDLALRALWEGVLGDHGHGVVYAAPDPAAWEVAALERPAIAIVELAVMESALDLCRRLRRSGWTPRPLILVLVPAEETGPMVAALEAGADDVLAGAPDRRAAVAHLTPLERRCGGATTASPTAHELVALRPSPGGGSPACSAAAEPAPEVVTALEALETHLATGIRQVRGDALLEIERAVRRVEELRHALGLAPVRPTAPDVAPPLEPAASPATILLIDDEASVRYPLRLALQHCGYRVLEAANGEEGLGLLARRTDIALVVVDQRMPRLSGSDVLREIRRRTRHLPVVLMSGQTLADTGAGALGPDAFLRKPFELADLARTVRRLIAPEVTRTA